MGKKQPEESANLGLAAALGLPMPPKARGKVYRLPPVRTVVNGRVALPSPRTPSEIETAVVAVQAGRIRVGGLINRGLKWAAGASVEVETTQLELSRGSEVPALVLRVSRKASAETQLNNELRLTLRSPDRYHLGVMRSGDQVLLAFRHSDPRTVMVLGSPSISLLMSDAWPDAL